MSASDRTQQPLGRVSLTAEKLDSKLNSLLIQSVNAERAPVDFGVMTSEAVFKQWDVSKSRWMADPCQVLCHYVIVVVVVVAVVVVVSAPAVVVQSYVAPNNIKNFSILKFPGILWAKRVNKFEIKF